MPKRTNEAPTKTTTYRRQRDDAELQRLTVYLPKELAKRLKVYCINEDRKTGELIEGLVVAFLKEHTG